MPLERVSQGFKDLSMTFQRSPLNGDLIAIKNATAISRSVKNIVLTLPGEKFFDPDFGSRVTASLFENVNATGSLLIVDEIRQSIRNYEPRVELVTVNVYPDFDNNSFDVIIVYNIIGADINAQQLEFVLQSTR